MARGKVYARALCLCAMAYALSRAPNAAAEPGSRTNLIPRGDERALGDGTAPSRVEVALSGVAQRKSALFERLRSLFPPDTQVVLRRTEAPAASLLDPERADTLYLWIRMSARDEARVYLAVHEDGSSGARYLYRSVHFDDGLDEVGSETLAQVAHSAAEALWFREQQIPKQKLVQALESEPEPSRELREQAQPPRAEPTTVQVIQDRPVITTDSADSSAARSAHKRGAAWAFALGARLKAYAAGDEGWLQEPGLFVGTDHGSLSLRAAANYVVPAEFQLSPARVRLSGMSGELRMGWSPAAERTTRVRLESGLGVWAGRWSPSLSMDGPAAHASSPHDFMRPFWLFSGAFEWSLGPAWLAACAELRLHFKSTRYEIAGDTDTRVSNRVHVGGGLELGVPFGR